MAMIKSRLDFQDRDLLGFKVILKSESFSLDSIWIIRKVLFYLSSERIISSDSTGKTTMVPSLERVHSSLTSSTPRKNII